MPAGRWRWLDPPGTVTGNIIIANLIGTDAFGRDGLGNRRGIRVECGDDNTLYGNVVSGSGWNGFLLRNSEDNTLKENTAIGNKYNGFRLGTGSSNNTLGENTATNNEGPAISTKTVSSEVKFAGPDIPVGAAVCVV